MIDFPIGTVVTLLTQIRSNDKWDTGINVGTKGIVINRRASDLCLGIEWETGPHAYCVFPAIDVAVAK